LSHIDWARLDPKTTSLLFLSPSSPIPPKQLSAWLHYGGKALVAEDFRDGSRLFETLGIPLAEEDTRFPVAVRVSTEDLPGMELIEEIQTNHPASFSISKAPLIAFPHSRRALLASLDIGSGKLLLLSDPSLFINDMISRKHNEKLLLALLATLTKDGRTLHICRQFSHSNWPKGISPGDSETDVGFKSFVPMIVREAKTILSKNRMGYRLLALGLLIPFIYAILFFAGSQTLWNQSAPPIYASVSSHHREWHRLLSLRDILYGKLSLQTGINPLLSSDHGRLKEHIRSGLGAQTAKNTLSLLRVLAKLPEEHQSFSGNWSPGKVESLCDEIEETIKILERI
ncbi:hypothetical protein KJ865_02105, partial [Myxococcota bacterium]|nr:hypothetical protein [Myxococcota bacterium]